MFFIYENGGLIGSPTSFIEDYNELLKTKKFLNTLDKQQLQGRYFQKLTHDKKVIVTEAVYHEMTPSKKIFCGRARNNL